MYPEPLVVPWLNVWNSACHGTNVRGFLACVRAVISYCLYYGDIRMRDFAWLGISPPCFVLEHENQQIRCQLFGEGTVSVLRTQFSECPSEMCSLETKEVIQCRADDGQEILGSGKECPALGVRP